jgi:hypothetical protein
MQMRMEELLTFTLGTRSACHTQAKTRSHRSHKSHKLVGALLLVG